MLPHRTKRGQAARDRLKVFDGIPLPYDKKQRMVVPAALKVVHLKPVRKFAYLGRLARINLSNGMACDCPANQPYQIYQKERMKTDSEDSCSA
ncbi:hypothetical protein EI555_015279 [Monodon monoceros]|uniref:60S ribosomal protein L13a n=1 Tax=Monodon monoceros TaxID=40151 RepID=A0A4U1EQB2_MONMO|nr:hypothetical protein EI555_015279 [Monodon monoceros]